MPHSNLRRSLNHLLACSALLSACGDALPIQLSNLREDQNDEALVTEAVAILGMNWEAAPKSYGAINLALVDAVDDMAANGITVVRGSLCYKSIVAIRDPITIAHEIAEVLGLDHVADEENLMHETQEGGVDLTGDQLDDLERSRRRLVCACPG